jgi:hypothetical protein
MVTRKVFPFGKLSRIDIPMCVADLEGNRVGSYETAKLSVTLLQ